MAEPDLEQRALASLILRHPFLANLALRLERIDDPTTETAWTDGVTLGINPTWFGELSDDQRLGLVAHECFHVALGHHLRRGSREPDRWNRACDYAVNALLVEDGLTLWPDALLDPAYGDASAEAIYNRLAASPKAPEPAAGPSGAQPGSGQPSAEPAPSPRPETFGEIRDQPFPTPPTPGEREALLAQHAILVAALAQQTRAIGKDSAGARRAAALATQTSSVDWRALLVEFLSSRHAQDYSWRRPNFRYVSLGIYYPVLESAAPGKIALVLDTSGSVPKEALEAVTGELEAYLLAFPATTLDVVYADASVAGRVSLTAADLPLQLEPVGGGGTHFGPALAALADDDPPPACVVYLTDLAGRFPDEPPPMPVIWLVFGQPLAVPTPPFGRLVLLPY
ncbi:MAG TPA: VWA-like domain-containing protein [Thermoanaerobaculia bacterium]|nr:VWA-like domain-containing protein [Thermoanaerobaculia bacterium]